jgi:hypothetical protein
MKDNEAVQPGHRGIIGDGDFVFRITPDSVAPFANCEDLPVGPGGISDQSADNLAL